MTFKSLDLFPYAKQRAKCWISPSDKLCKFSHYTSADTAIKIIRTRELWMRNVRTMNDFSEVKHGLELHDKALKKFNGRIKSAWGKIDPEWANQLDLNNDWLRQTLLKKSYVTSFAEHDLPEKSSLIWGCCQCGGRMAETLMLHSCSITTNCD